MGDLYQGERDPENDPLRPPRIGEAYRYVPFSNRNQISNISNNNKECSEISTLKVLRYVLNMLIFFLKKCIGV